MVLGNVARITALATGLAAWWPRQAGALPVPDAALMASLQRACDHSQSVRVRTARTGFEVNRPTLDSNGVRVSRAPSRAALITIGEVREVERRIPWADVVRVETGHTRGGRWALFGALGGGIAGGVLVSTYGPDIAEEGDNGIVYFGTLLTLIGGGLGLLLGLSSPQWQPLYP